MSDASSFGLEPRPSTTDAELGPKLGALTELSAHTVNRRMGRSMRKPPGPSMDDAADGDSSETSDAAQEELGTALMDELSLFLSKRAGIEQFFTALDGRNSQERSEEDAEALDRLMRYLLDRRLFSATVISIRPNTAATVRVGGRLRVLRLAGPVGSIWLSRRARHAIAVSAALTLEETQDEIAVTLAAEIEMIAAEQGVPAMEGALFRFLGRVFSAMAS